VLLLEDVLRVPQRGGRGVQEWRDTDGEQVAGQGLLAVLGDGSVRAAVRVREVQQPVPGIGVKPLGPLVEVDPPGSAVRRVGEPALDVHPPRLAGLRVRADQQHGIVGAHPVVDVGWLAQEVEEAVVLARKRPVAGLALHEDQPVGNLSGHRVA